MIRNLLVCALVSYFMVTEASAIGWNCKNPWGGDYTFTADGSGNGSIYYRGPLSAIDVATGARYDLWGRWWNLQIGRHFEFSVPGFSYSCSSYNNGVDYWCDGTGGNPGVALTACYGRVF